MNIQQKLVEIRKTVDGFSKDKKSFNYEYVSGNQILRKIKVKMDELQVLLIPSVDYSTLSWCKHEYVNGKGKDCLDFIVQASMSYKWVNAEEPTDFIEIPWLMVGQQSDDISKAVGTGLTYNERYFLLKQFGVPTDEDDADAKKVDGGGKSKGNNNSISDAQIKRMYALGNAASVTPKQIADTISKSYGINDPKLLTKTQYEEVCKRLEAKKGK